MENASKALLMAGGILIALLILGALIMMFTSLQDYQNSNDARTKNTQIAEFNNQFEPYNKDGLTLMELKSVYNKIESNNNQHSKDINGNIDRKSGYFIDDNIEEIFKKEIEIKRGGVTVKGRILFEDFKNSFKTLEDQFKQYARFKCTEIEYNNPEGRISKIFFGQ